MTTVLVASKPDDTALRALPASDADVRFVVGWTVADFAADAAQAEVLLSCAAGRDVLRPIVLAAPRLRWLHTISAGVDGILFPELVDGPILATNARGVFSAALGEWTMAAVLFFAKDLRRLVRAQAARQWDPADVEMLEGHTVGIVGYGDIGRAVARRAQAFGMHVIGLRRQAAGTDDLGTEVVGIDRLLETLPRCDYVVAAAPLTAETHGLVGPAAFAAMKPEAVFVNVGRGPVVDEAALIDALRAGRIRGAALDVFEHEPLPRDSALFAFENVLLSPHCADHVAGWREASMRVFLENLARFRSGQPLRNVVDKARGY